MTNKNKGYIYGLICYLIWGSLPIFWKLLDDLEPLYIFSSRVIYSFILTLILIIVLKKKNELIKVLKQPKKVALAVSAGVFIAANWLTFIIAVTSDNTVDAALGYFINPLVVVLTGTIFFKEKLSGLAKLSICIAAIGVIISTLMFNEFPLVPIILALTFTIYGAIKKINGIDTYISLFIETLTILPFAIYIVYKFSSGGTNLYTSGDIGLNIPVMLPGAVTLIPLLLYSQAINLIPFNTIGFFQYINPTMVLSLGIFVYHETITAGQLISFCFIWVALGIYIYSLVKQNQIK